MSTSGNSNGTGVAAMGSGNNHGTKVAAMGGAKARSWKEFGGMLAAQAEPESAHTTTYRICNHCNKPVLETVLAKHITECLRKKAAGNSRAPVPAPVPAPEHSSTPAAALPPKRKPEPEAEPHRKNAKKAKKAREVVPKKARKEKLKPMPKVKGPVDVEKQCGVPLPNGGFCARSLTCKTHSMGAKRAVMGRLAPYDQLLLAYQRKNQQRAAAGVAAAQAARDDMETAALDPLDPDEETHQVLEGLGKNLAYPLERHTIAPARIRARFVRMREMFAAAILPRGVANGMGSVHGRVGILDVDKPAEQQWVYVKGPQRHPARRPGEQPH